MVIIISTSIVCITLLIIGFFVRREFIKSMELKEKELKNKKFELFNSIDIVKIKEIVDNYIEDYINRYAINKFIANDVLYIKPKDQEEMARNITKNIILDLSEVYVHYISLLASIDNDEDLVRFVNVKVKTSTMDFVASYNKARNETMPVKIL